MRDGIWVPSRSFLTTLNFCNQYCFHLHSANGQAVKRGTSLKYSLQPFIYMYNTQGHTSEFLLHCIWTARGTYCMVFFLLYISILVFYVPILLVISIILVCL